MINNTVKMALTSLLILMPSVAFADNKADKLIAVEKYLEISNVDKMMNGMVDAFKKNPNIAGDKQAIEVAIKSYDMDAVKSEMKRSMASRFTLEEINMLNEFYITPQGQSILEKMPMYMADIMPLMQKEMQKSAVAVNAYMKSKQASKVD